MDTQNSTTFTPTSVQHVQVQTGVAGGDYNQGNWTLDEGSGTRFLTVHVNFPSSFRKAPTVSIGNVMLDASHGANTRVSAAVSNITASGFDLTVNTWADTVLYAARYSWLAIAV